MRYKTKRRLLAGFTILVVVILYTFKNYSTWLRSLSAIGCLVGFYLVDHLFHLDFKTRHYFFAIFISVTSFLLSPLYFIYPNYDKVLHFVIPMMLGSMSYHILGRMNIRRRDRLILSFFIVAAMIGLWEVSEYWMDYFFDLKLQGVFLRGVQGLNKYDLLMDRIDDTMIDMSLGAFGILIYCGIIGLTEWIRHKRKNIFLIKDSH